MYVLNYSEIFHMHQIGKDFKSQKIPNIYRDIEQWLANFFCTGWIVNISNCTGQEVSCKDSTLPLFHKSSCTQYVTSWWLCSSQALFTKKKKERKSSRLDLSHGAIDFTSLMHRKDKTHGGVHFCKSFGIIYQRNPCPVHSHICYCRGTPACVHQRPLQKCS